MAVTGDLARYRDIERLGVGGMATVTLAEDTMLRRRVALKRVHAGGDRRAIMRLRREALVGASLSHPNLVAIYDVEIGAVDDLVIVMEYVAGGTLRDAIARAGGLPHAFVLEVLAGVASALDAIHARGIVHRDVKPANILLGSDGAIKLADLGIAVAADRTQITSAGVILGTFSYMAPEQLEGDASTPAVDIYALAVVAFEMLSGEKARPQTNPVALAHAMATRPPPDLCAVCADAPPAAAAVLALGMHADPGQRPRSAGEFVRRLRSAFTPEAGTSPLSPPDAARPSLPPRPSAPPVAAPPPVPPRPSAPPVAAPPPVPPGPSAAPRGAPPPSPAPRPSAAPARERDEQGPAPPAAGVVPSPGTVEQPRRPRAGLRPGSSGLILAVVAALAVAALALALIDSGGPPRRGTSTTTARRTGTSPAAAASKTSRPANGAAAATATAGNQSTAAPAGAVETFYAHAAAHDYAGAWALADPAFRAQLEGYASFAAGQSRVRSITFHEARVTSQGSQTATVALRTTSVLVSATQQCQGTVDLERPPGGPWLLHQISINCV